MLESTAKRPRAAHAPAGLEAAEMLRPKTVDEAIAALGEAAQRGSSVMVLAGGTDVIVDRHLLPVERAHAVERVVDVTGIDGFHAIAAREGRLELAGGVTYWDLRRSAEVKAKVPMLADMARDVGAVQIQTRGTLAGNIATASPAADGVAALMALDAEVHLASVAGTRQVALTQFFTGYRKTVMRADELIVRIDLRLPSPGARVAWRKVGTRQAQSISKVALASLVEASSGTLTHVRFGMASVAASTHPLEHARRYLEGRAEDAVDSGELDRALAQDIQPIDDVRSTGEYRMHVARSLLRRALR